MGAETPAKRGRPAWVVVAAASALLSAGCAGGPNPGSETLAPGLSAPDSCRAWFRALPGRFNPKAARGIRATYLFILSEDTHERQTWTVVVRDGTCTVTEGASREPDATLRATCSDWLLLASRELSGWVAFLSGRLRVSGDRGLARHLEPLFFRLDEGGEGAGGK
jgi:hypothetical protein